MVFKVQPRRLLQIGNLLIALAVGAAAPGFAEAGALDEAKSDGVIIAIANEPPYAFMNADGAPTGAGPELDKAILREAGITKFSGNVMEYGAMIPAVQSGRATFASVGSLVINKERCQNVIFSEPLICDGGSFVLANALESKIKTVEDIAAAGLKVGVCGGCVSHTLATKAGIPDDKIIIFPDANSGLKLLADGRIDVFFHDTLSTSRLYKTLVDNSAFRYEPLTSVPISCQGAAFNKSDTDLRDAYNEGIRKVKASGEYIEILKKFNFEGAAFGVDTVNTEQLCNR
ncbi:MAG: ectoine/hydroxyectoine ABC transporter substrate-binding protein EhuB [Mesorhizobium sp.]|uniref:ectoine/hydroxyectoine ABC transporter substrate-binding protein EhuB n=1 Tax=Mesorhizobium sp. TaxID=1871066 RepID=UPI000FE7C345|nr:ectoine/hydroxyectoine ABC transporter substrate-binding protein EhuB [Mesorhizobium sp.]RWF89920.1 MAG: ectoine/hydroxyectoine ABC transporter substrate-binding protein EhuB [Mesorhizobium sp.]RWJ45216.1 MAG: ectoine/hydroxyectoine ABC transporter substrate-binding protein EhuB [Mesorhizobium sp.]RWJ56598.1 MAG: ectoine/hydroxyectoine ABC transporter substrate-binding protein EhuB [Mesorhizobium sp.]RWJ60851.1 MAG: ectoine/hydroxyectoine ABC transporter substrate-binding protein EhuB [Mesor